MKQYTYFLKAFCTWVIGLLIIYGLKELDVLPSWVEMYSFFFGAGSTFYFVICACSLLNKQYKEGERVIEELKETFLRSDLSASETLRSLAREFNRECEAQVELQNRMKAKVTMNDEEDLAKMRKRVAEAKANFWEAVDLAWSINLINKPDSHKDYLEEPPRFKYPSDELAWG